MKAIMRDSYGVFLEGDVRGGSGTPSTLGCIERWYEGGSQGYGGIMVPDGKLEIPGLIIPGNGVPLDVVNTFGVGMQSAFYDSRSALMEGSVVTYSTRRKFMRGPAGKDLSMEIAVSEVMPKNILTIIAETSDGVLRTAKILRAPVEKVTGA